MGNLRKIGEEVGCSCDTTRYYPYPIFVQEPSLLVLEGNVSILGYYLLWDIIEFLQVQRTRARNVTIVTVIVNVPVQGCGILPERGETARWAGVSETVIVTDAPTVRTDLEMDW